MNVKAMLEMLERWGFDTAPALARVNHSPMAKLLLSCPVIFSGRMTSTAGRASYKRIDGTPRWIKLSERLFSNGKAEVFDTFTHELAHLLTPGAHHGAAWKHAHRSIGGSGKTYHSYENMRRVRRTVKLIAKCMTCDREYRRVKRLSANRTYRCHCGGELIRY